MTVDSGQWAVDSGQPWKYTRVLARWAVKTIRALWNLAKAPGADRSRKDTGTVCHQLLKVYEGLALWNVASDRQAGTCHQMDSMQGLDQCESCGALPPCTWNDGGKNDT